VKAHGSETNSFFNISYNHIAGKVCAASKDPLRNPVRQLQKGIVKEDTSYAYSLPFEPGNFALCWCKAILVGLLT
jgi:hypothetical protein